MSEKMEEKTAKSHEAGQQPQVHPNLDKLIKSIEAIVEEQTKRKEGLEREKNMQEWGVSVLISHVFSFLHALYQDNIS